MITIGELSLWMSLLTALGVVLAASAGGARARDDLVQYAARALRAAAGFNVLAFGVLCWASVRSDFTVQYVANHSSSELPFWFRLSAVWSGGAGALLLANTVAALVAWRLDGRGDGTGLRAARLALLGALLSALSADLIILSNPFVRFAAPVAEGRGLAPALQSWPAAADAPLVTLAVVCAVAWATLVVTNGARVRCARAAITAAVAILVLLGVRALGAYTVDAAPLTAATLFSARRVSPLMLIVAVAVGSYAWYAGPRRPRGALLGAVGVLLVVSALGGGLARRAQTGDLGDGQRMELRDAFGASWTFTSQGASRIERPGFLLTAAVLRTVHAGGAANYVTSEVRDYGGDGSDGDSSIQVRPGVQRSLLMDARVVVRGVNSGGVTIDIELLPLASLGWIGLALMALALPISAWPLGATRRLP